MGMFDFLRVGTIKEELKQERERCSTLSTALNSERKLRKSVQAELSKYQDEGGEKEIFPVIFSKGSKGFDRFKINYPDKKKSIVICTAKGYTSKIAAINDARRLSKGRIVLTFKDGD